MSKHFESYNFITRSIVLAALFLFLSVNYRLSAQSGINSIKQKLQAIQEDSLKIDLYDSLSREYLYTQPDSAQFYIDTLKMLSKSLKSERALALAHNRQGTYEIVTGDLNAALISLAKAQELFTRLKDSLALASVYNNLASNDYYAQDYTSSLANYKKGMKMLNPSKHSRLYTIFLTNLSEVFRANKLLDSAVLYAQKGIEFSKKLNDSQLLATAHFNMGAVKLKQKSYPEALDYFNKALDNKRLPLQYVMLANIHKAITMIALDRLREAQVLLDGIEAEVSSSKDRIVKLKFYTAKKDFFKKSEDYKQALYYSEKYERLNERINNLNRSRLRKNLRAKFDLHYQKNENQSLRHEAEINGLKIINQRNIIWAVGVFIFVLMILLIVMNRLYEINQKANEKLRTKHEVLDKNNKNLEKINNQKNNLFSIVAHDVKSPLSAIMTSIGMLNENIEDFSEEEIKILTQELSTQTKSLYNFLEGVLTWAKSQMDGYKFNKKNVKVLQLIDELITIERFTLRKKKLKIINKIPQELEVFADPQAMTVIMRNLLNNAIKFTPPGGNITFTVDQNDKESIIAVQDTGLGLSQDKIEQIFVKRQRYTRNGTGDEKGNGIGLILCSEIANTMGGGIEVKSTVGRGSTFALVLPNTNS